MASGHGTLLVMRCVGVSKRSASCGPERFLNRRVDWFPCAAAHPPESAPVPKSRVREVLRLTGSAPSEEAAHRTLPAAAPDASLVLPRARKIWRTHGPSPRRLPIFELSKDPALADRHRELLWRRMSPPEHAAAFAICGPSQLPGREVRVIHDNFARHRTRPVHQWLVDRPSGKFRFTPASSSWPSNCEGLLVMLTRYRRRHSSFRSIAECAATIQRVIGKHNVHDGRTFEWTPDPERIVVAGNRRFRMIESSH